VTPRQTQASPSKRRWNGAIRSKPKLPLCKRRWHGQAQRSCRRNCPCYHFK